MKKIGEIILMNFLKKNKKVLIGTAIVLFVSLIIWYFSGYKNDSAKSAEVTYTKTKASTGDIIVDLYSDGTIDYEKVNLQFEISGLLKEVLINNNQKVEEGDIIARINDKEYQEEYLIALSTYQESLTSTSKNFNDYQGKLLSAENSLKKMKDEFEIMEMMKDEYSSQEITDAEIEIKTQEILIENYKLSLQELEKEINGEIISKSEINLRLAKENLEDTILYAPSDGTLLSLNYSAGETVQAEKDFAVIHKAGIINATASIIEYDISQVEVGQKVYVEVDAIPDQKYSGFVKEISAIPSSNNNGIVSYEVIVELTDGNENIKDGMTCSLSFVIKEVNDVIIVPYNSVFIEDGQQCVYVDEKGNMSKREIRAGFTDGTDVEIVEGLNPGETVYVKAGV
jgi:macrolide-specific efflux system membrane fusion protein